MKVIKFRPNIAKADYQTKLKAITRLLQKNEHVKITVTFRGREVTHSTLGTDLMENIRKDLVSVSWVSSPQKMSGKEITMVLGAKPVQQAPQQAPVKMVPVGSARQMYESAVEAEALGNLVIEKIGSSVT